MTPRVDNIIKTSNITSWTVYGSDALRGKLIVMIVFGTVSDFPYIYDDRGRVNWLTWLCRLKHARCWRCANTSVTSLRMGDISTRRRRTCLSASAELISCDHVGLGAAADARGQVAEISIFNLINNLVLRSQEELIAGQWCVNIDVAFMIDIWRSRTPSFIWWLLYFY